MLLACCGRTALTDEATLDAAVIIDAPDAGAPADAGLVSEIHFEDAHFTTGNPRKVNPNRRDDTDLDNVVRLSVESFRGPGALSLDWRTDLGTLDTTTGAEVRFRSPREGTAHITCTATERTSGATEARETTVVVRRGFRHGALLRGDYVVFNASAPGTVRAVDLRTRAERDLGPGTLLAFDGETVVIRPLRSGDRNLVLWRVSDWTTRTLAPPSIQTVWDYRWVQLSNGRLFWSTTDQRYTQDTLYSMRLDGGPEQRLHGPTALRGVASHGGDLVFSEVAGTMGTFDSFRSLIIENAAPPRALPAVDAASVVRSWFGPWLSTTSSRGSFLVERSSGRALEVRSLLGSVTSVVVSATHSGGHDRDPFSSRGGAVFLDALDGTTHWRYPLDTNDFVNPSIDGQRIAWVHRNAVWLYEAP